MLFFKIKNPQIEDLRNDLSIKDNRILNIPDENICSGFEKYFDCVTLNILNAYSSDKQKIKLRKGWLTTYKKFDTNEFHTHEDAVFKSRGSHVMIQVLETGSLPENLIFIDNGQKVSVEMSIGDIIIFHTSTVHGLETTLEKLKVLVFAITL